MRCCGAASTAAWSCSHLDKIGRAAILKVHTRTVPLAPDVDLTLVASTTPGLVGADLRNLVNEAALLAARRGQDTVRQKDFMDALEKIALGPARPIVLSPAERERVANHEGGHAVLGLSLPGADPVTRVTITPHGQALGVTYQRPETTATTTTRPICERASSAPSADGRRRKSSTAREPPVQKVTCSRRRALPVRW